MKTGSHFQQSVKNANWLFVNNESAAQKFDLNTCHPLGCRRVKVLLLLHLMLCGLYKDLNRSMCVDVRYVLGVLTNFAVLKYHRGT